MGDTFFFILPVTLTILGVAFLLLWRWGSPAAFWWGVGYLLGASVFVVAVLPEVGKASWPNIVADVFYTSSIACYSQALVTQYGVSSSIRTRMAIIALFGCGSAFSTLILRSFPVQLALGDLSALVLLGQALFLVRRRMKHSIDKALGALLAIMIVDAITRGSTVYLTAPESAADFLESEYGVFYQTTSAIFGIILALLAFAVVMIEVLARYRSAADTDPLTGLLNRRGFESALLQCSSGKPADGCVLTCDIDLFKTVNDQFGHAAGDRAIVALAETLRRNLPSGAVVARFGGEEFVAYLPGGNGADAYHHAEAIRTGFAALDWAVLIGRDQLTASFGIDAVRAADFSVHDALSRADAGLYSAKRSGRNCTRTALSVVPAPPQIVRALG